MKKPLVSIVICCYNREHYLRQAMESIFAQQYDPVEIVVLDDGSTDGTHELMKTYGDKVRYFRQENQGVVSARNNGCMHAKGEYIAFMDDDDLMPPDRIVVLHGALQQYPDAVMAVGDWAVIDTEGNYTGRRWLPKGSSMNEEPILIRDGYEAILWPKVPAAPHTTLFPRDIGEKIGWFDKKYHFASEDKDFFARMGRLGPIVYVPKVVSYYRCGHESLTSSKMMAAYHKLFLLKNHLKSIGAGRLNLRKRLKFRILTELRKIAYYRSKGITVPDVISDQYIYDSLSLLSFSYRLNYYWVSLIRYPIREILRKLIKALSVSNALKK